MASVWLASVHPDCDAGLRLPARPQPPPRGEALIVNTEALMR